MLRDKSLIPLSHQHQHALALCVRIDRASPIPDADVEVWRMEIQQQFQSEIRVHFATEETVLFPVAKDFPDLTDLVDDLIRDHGLLREYLLEVEAGTISAAQLHSFAKTLAGHIRKEERQLFEGLQKLMEPAALTALGARLADALADAQQTCVAPNEITRLRAADQT